MSIGYVFLAIALLAGLAKGFCGKKTSIYTPHFNDAIYANCVRMLLCVVIGFLLIALNRSLSELKPISQAIIISAISGVSSAVFVVSWLLSIRKSAYMLLDTFLSLSTLIPLIGSEIFFGEKIKITQWFGMALLFIAIIVMCSYNNSIKKHISLFSLLLLFICALSNGISDFSQKIYTKQIVGGSIAVFNFYTYLFASLVLLITLVIAKKTSKKPDKPIESKIFIFIPIMAVCLFLYSYFKTLAATRLDAILLYPLSQGCSLILSSIMSVVAFKEKITFKAVCGILLVFISLLIINIL